MRNDEGDDHDDAADAATAGCDHDDVHLMTCVRWRWAGFVDDTTLAKKRLNSRTTSEPQSSLTLNIGRGLHSYPGPDQGRRLTAISPGAYRTACTNLPGARIHSRGAAVLLARTNGQVVPCLTVGTYSSAGPPTVTYLFHRTSREVSSTGRGVITSPRDGARDLTRKLDADWTPVTHSKPKPALANIEGPAGQCIYQ